MRINGNMFATILSARDLSPMLTIGRIRGKLTSLNGTREFERYECAVVCFFLCDAREGWMANCELKVQCIREGRARPIAALRVRFAQATRRLRRGRILRVRWPHAVFGRAGAHDGEAPSPCRFRSSGISTLPLPISVAMAPSPSHRGKAPYGTRRRGAPLLRPLARLTSFGGYVATGARLHCK